MRTFLSNDRNDLALGEDGLLQIGNSFTFRAQAYAQFMQARLGEMIHAVQRGMPYEQVIWIGSPNVAQFEAAGRATLMQVAGTVEVLSFSARLADNVLSYTANILTDSGEITVNG
jgi:hypothetical protein